MKLELKHISPYLPYGLKCQTFWINEDNSIEEEGISEIVGIKIDCDNSTENPIKVVRKTRPNSKYLTYYAYNYNECKPILRPLSDLTKDELREQGFWHHIDYLTHEKQNPIKAPYKMVEYLFSKHFDVFGLIESGLAIDINTITK